ncbi:MAG: CBS domain-containing protein [Phycisphaeraceae bacterium]
MTGIKAPGAPRGSVQAMKAADIMVKDVVSVGPEASVKEAAALMLERRISGLPVVDGGGRILGVVSEGDLIRRPEIGTDQAKASWLHFFLSDEQRARDFVKSHGRKVREVMTQPAIGVPSDAPLTEVVRLMERHRVKRLPVVERGRLAGLVTRADLLRALVARQAQAPVAASDQELRVRIESILRSEDWAASAVVHAQVENGVALLWGTVESEEQREALLVAVRGVPGVKDVQPHLGRVLPG